MQFLKQNLWSYLKMLVIVYKNDGLSLKPTQSAFLEITLWVKPLMSLKIVAGSQRQVEKGRKKSQAPGDEEDAMAPRNEVSRVLLIEQDKDLLPVRQACIYHSDFLTLVGLFSLWICHCPLHVHPPSNLEL